MQSAQPNCKLRPDIEPILEMSVSGPLFLDLHEIPLLFGLNKHLKQSLVSHCMQSLKLTFFHKILQQYSMTDI